VVLTSEIVTTAQGLQALEPEWTDLWERTPHRAVTTAHWWMRTFWRERATQNPLRIVCVREGGRLVLLAPLMAVRVPRGPLVERWLQALSGYESGAPDFLYAEPSPARFQAFWDRLTALPDWDCLALWQLPTASPTGVHLLRAAEARGLRFRLIPESEGWIIRTDGSWEALEQGLDRKFRENLRRRRRQLEAQHGPMSLHRITRPEDVGAVMDTLVALSQRAEAGRGRNALGPLHQALLTEAAARGCLLLDILEAAGAPIAYNVQFLAAGRATSLVIGYDPAWARFGPGHLLQAESLRRHLTDARVAVYDLMAGGTEHKRDWARQTEGYQKVYVYAATLCGQAVQLVHGLGLGLNRGGVIGLGRSLGRRVHADLSRVRARLGPAPALRRARLAVNGRVLDAEVAVSREERARGLSHRRRLAQDGAMLFALRGRPTFWMKDTRVPLDLAFIGADGRILAVEPMVPGSLVPVRGPASATFALEVNRGWFASHGVGVGDRVEWPPWVAAVHGEAGTASPAEGPPAP
jgi:hypothetical protein